MKKVIWVLKWSAIISSFGLIIPITAIYSCVYGDNPLNSFFRELAYTVHAATPSQVVVASPDKPKSKLKSKRVKQCFASNDGVKQCK